jgi:hypothetical protein
MAGWLPPKWKEHMQSTVQRTHPFIATTKRRVANLKYNIGVKVTKKEEYALALLSSLALSHRKEKYPIPKFSLAGLMKIVGDINASSVGIVPCFNFKAINKKLAAPKLIMALYNYIEEARAKCPKIEFGCLQHLAFIIPYAGFDKDENKDMFDLKTFKKKIKTIMPRIIYNASPILVLMAKYYIKNYTEEIKSTLKDGTAVGMSPLYGGFQKLFEHLSEFKTIEDFLAFALDAPKMDHHYPVVTKFTEGLKFLFKYDWSGEWNIHKEVLLLFINMTITNLMYPHLSLRRGKNMCFVNKQILPSGDPNTTNAGNHFSSVTISAMIIDLIQRFPNRPKRLYNYMVRRMSLGDDLLGVIRLNWTKVTTLNECIDGIEKIVGLKYKKGECHDKSDNWVPLLTKIDYNKGIIIEEGADFLKNRLVKVGGNVVYFKETKHIIGRLFQHKTCISSINHYCDRLSGIAFSVGLNKPVHQLIARMLNHCTRGKFYSYRPPMSEEAYRKVKTIDVPCSMDIQFYYNSMLGSGGKVAFEDSLYKERYPLSHLN